MLSNKVNRKNLYFVFVRSLPTRESFAQYLSKLFVAILIPVAVIESLS